MLRILDPIQNMDQSKTGFIQIGIQIPAEDTLVRHSDHGLQTKLFINFLQCKYKTSLNLKRPCILQSKL